MNNNGIKKVLSLAVITAALTAATVVEAANQPNVSPFTDTLTTHLVGFPSAITVAYTSNNGVNISGNTTVPLGMSSFPVTIHSENEFENGFPSMVIGLSDGTVCQLQFVDGPLSFLGYESGSAPSSCPDVSASLITQSDQYQYDVTLTYK